MPFAFDELSAERFFDEYWRKKPVLIKGGASRILDFEVDVPFFRRVCQKLERSPLVLVNREPGFIFAQKMDEAEPRFRAISRRYEELVSVKRVWFDGVYTTDTHTIGCHYDHSDNFVMQQSGTKHWKLASPKMIPASEIRERMLESRNVGHIHMPDECEDFILEAGDVLYIPLFWAHWGVSHGTAMSVSLVLNADAPVDVLAKPLAQVLSEHQSWVEPLPAVPRPQAGQAPSAEVQLAFDRLFDALAAPATREALRERIWQEVFVSPPRPAEDSAHPNGSIYGASARVQLATRIDLPRDRIQSLLDREWPEPNLDALLEPGADSEALLAHFGQRSWARAAHVLDAAYQKFHEASAWPMIESTFTELASQDDERALWSILDPELVAYIWRIEEAFGFSYAPRFEELTAEFGLIRERSVKSSAPESDFLATDHPWLDEHYPRGRRFGGRRLDRSPAARVALDVRRGELTKEIGELPPTVQDELRRLLRAALPMAAEPSAPATHSIEPFFGSVLIEPRRVTLDDLIFEAGRFRARAIAGIIELTDQSRRERVLSPFDDTLMSPRRLFADAFGRYYAATVRGRAPTQAVREAWKRLTGCTTISDAGRELLGALSARAYERAERPELSRSE